MAKGNLFQGMARGKVGDVVFSRLNGEQISRVRNRHPKNPRSNAQLYQRAIMATIMQAYAAGREIFDHSFQGFATGMDNQREFMSRNMDILRSIIRQDIVEGNTGETTRGKVVPPKANKPTPFAGMLVSRGTLENDVLTLAANGTSITMKNVLDSVGKTVEQYFSEIGVNVGDIFTIVAFKGDNTRIYQISNTTSPYAAQFNMQFGWIRFIAKNTLEGNISESTPLSNVFEIQTGGDIFDENKIKALTMYSLDAYQIYDLFVNGNEKNAGAAAIIRSRFDVDLRSTAELILMNNNNAFGISSDNILQAWTKEIDTIGNSELILEGSDANFQ